MTRRTPLNKLSSRALFAVALFAALSVTAGSAHAQTADRGVMPEKHDSNTLSKIGKAIQYPVRKAGENTSKSTRKAAKATQYVARKGGEHASVVAHQATGHKSVIRRRAKGVNRIVTPKGTLKTLSGKTIK